jgi:hypothetical protein
MKSFCEKVKKVLHQIVQTPLLLEKEAIGFLDIDTRFREQGVKGKQSTSNKATDHEVCFAAVLEEVGFQFVLKKKKGDHLKEVKTLPDGNYYIYQVNGSQKPLDFQVFCVQNHKIIKSFDFDLKHTTSNIFYLNDGWFEENVMYIISWREGLGVSGQHKLTIALGQDIPTEKDKEIMAAIQCIKKETNAANKKQECQNLIVYSRFANKYSCKDFTEEWNKDRFEKVTEFIESSNV